MKIKVQKTLFISFLILLTYTGQGQDSIWMNACNSKFYRGQNFINESFPYLLTSWLITLLSLGILFSKTKQILPNRKSLLFWITSVLLGTVTYTANMGNDFLLIQPLLCLAWTFSIIFSALSFVTFVWNINELSGFITLLFFAFLGGLYYPIVLKVI